jgi:hypothetical protein
MLMSLVMRALAVVVLASGCSDSRRTPSTPSPLATAGSPGVVAASSLPRVEVTGVVYEMTVQGPRPLPGVSLDMSVEYQSWPPRATTDADGRYSLGPATIAPAPQGLKLIAEKAGYSQPCRTAVENQPRHDIYLVSNDLLAASGMPASFSIVPPVLEGLVFEETPEGRQPIAGASVVLDFTGGMGWAPSARTTTNAEGRYVLCNVVDATGLGFAALVGRTGYAERFLETGIRPGSPFDVELKRLAR